MKQKNSVLVDIIVLSWSYFHTRTRGRKRENGRKKKTEWNARELDRKGQNVGRERIFWSGMVGSNLAAVYDSTAVI